MPRYQGPRKVLTKRRCSRSAPAVLHSPCKRRRKQWTNEQMESAMEAIHTATCGVNEAAIMYGVPATTLKDRISGKVKHGTKSGPPKYFRRKRICRFFKKNLLRWALGRREEMC